MESGSAAVTPIDHTDSTTTVQNNSGQSQIGAGKTQFRILTASRCCYRTLFGLLPHSNTKNKHWPASPEPARLCRRFWTTYRSDWKTAPSALCNDNTESRKDSEGVHLSMPAGETTKGPKEDLMNYHQLSVKKDQIRNGVRIIHSWQLRIP